LKVQNFELQRQDLLVQYVPTSDEIQRVDIKIRELRTFLNESVRQTLDHLENQSAEVGRAIVTLNEAIKTYPEKERKLVQLERDVSLNEGMFNYLVRKQTELAIGQSANFNPHKVIDHAVLPQGLASPNKPLLYGLAFFLALLAGMTFAYLRYYFTARVRYASDLEERLSLPVIGEVFRLKTEAKSSYPIVRHTLANLQQLPEMKEHFIGNILTVTSMVPGEGKSFVAQHLAQAYASSGKKVLLIDTDCRQPILYQRLGVTNEEGLVDILLGRSSLFASIQSTPHYGMSIVPAGYLPDVEQALFYHYKVKDMLRELREAFDLIIIDTPPLGLFQDAVPFMQQANTNLFVLRADFTRTRLLRSIKKQLSELRELPIQLVLNDSKRAWTLPGYRRYLRKYYRA